MPHDPSPLIGRAALVAEVVRRARAGSGSVLTGSPGSGGTRVLDEVQQALRRGGLRTARLRVGTAALRPGGSPFLGLLDRSALAALPGGDRALLRAVLELDLEVLAVEDARRLTAADGAILLEVARSGAAVVANATGPGGMPDALRTCVDEARAIVVPLGPLTDDEVAELAGQLLGDPVDGELGQALASAAEGRPGTLAELVDDAVGASAIVHADGLWHLAAPLPAPRTVRAAVLDAFSSQPPEQRGWLASVATAGSIAPDLAARIAAPATIAAAAETGWTVDDDGRTRIASPAVATAVLDSLDVRARIAVRRRLVDASTAVQRPLVHAELVARARWRIELGDPQDPEEALALAALPDTDPASREVLLRAALEGGAPAGAALADHLRRTRRPEEALRLIDAAMPAAATDDERVALVRVATMVTGIVERRSGEALEALEAHLASRCSHPDLLAVRAGLLLMEARPREAVTAAGELLSAGTPSGFAAAFAHLQVAVGLRELGEREAALAAADRFTALHGVEAVYQEGAALARWLPAEIAVATGADLQAAEDVLAAEHARVPADQRTRRRPPLAYTLGCIRTLRAEPAAGVRLLREAEGGGGAWRESWRPRVLAELTIAQVLTGALDDAAGTLERLLRLTCPPVQQGRVRLATAQLSAARGDLDGAMAIVADLSEEGVRHGLVLDAFDAAFAGIRYGDAAAPARLLALGPLPSGGGRDAQRAYASALQGGDPEAVDDAAGGLWERGLRLHALEAAARAADLGAVGATRRLIAWLARTEGLRLAGVTDRRGSGLTAREREVALRAAAGASDRIIADELGVTLRTAQTHLSRAFAKLGVHRRSDLRELLEQP